MKKKRYDKLKYRYKYDKYKKKYYLYKLYFGGTTDSDILSCYSYIFKNKGKKPGGDCIDNKPCVNYTISCHGCKMVDKKILPENTALYFYVKDGYECTYDLSPNICCRTPQICDHWTKGDKIFKKEYQQFQEYNDMWLWKKEYVHSGIVDCKKTIENDITQAKLRTKSPSLIDKEKKIHPILVSTQNQKLSVPQLIDKITYIDGLPIPKGGVLLSKYIELIQVWHNKYHMEPQNHIANIHILACRTDCSE